MGAPDAFNLLDGHAGIVTRPPAARGALRRDAPVMLDYVYRLNLGHRCGEPADALHLGVVMDGGMELLQVGLGFGFGGRGRASHGLAALKDDAHGVAAGHVELHRCEVDSPAYRRRSDRALRAGISFVEWWARKREIRPN